MYDIHARAEQMGRVIQTYFDGCNEADVGKMLGCFTPDAVHYFPPGKYEGPFRRGEAIAENWCQAVEELGSFWTIDMLLVEPATHQAMIEWTRFNAQQNKVRRGIEWYEFEESSGLIREIRTYCAPPQSPDRKVLEPGGLDFGPAASTSVLR